jgi:hypothetical protein
MRLHLFNWISADISKLGNSEHFKYFKQLYDVVDRKGLSPRQKVTCAILPLAYDASADQCDKYIHISESTAIKCLQNFCRYVVEVYSAKCLRKPNQDDINHIVPYHQAKHGFPRMLGSIDCMHWSWKNCPTAWRG